MSLRTRAWLIGLTVAAGTAGLPGRASAQEERHSHLERNVFWRFLRHKHETPPPGKPRNIPHTMERAGNPLCLSKFADFTNTPEYQGYYVGGSAPLGHGDGRCEHEGTFGWDYVGVHYFRRVMLGWNHGRHYQSGIGYYATDGPPVKDPVAHTVEKLRKHSLEESGEEE